MRLRLDGERRRVYTEQFEYVTLIDERASRTGFLELWVRIERSKSVEDVISSISAWRAVNGSGA